MTIWEKLLLPDGYARLNLREWMLGATPTGKSLIMQEARKMVCKNIIENKQDGIFWFDENASIKK